MSSLVFSAKNFTIILLEIPTISIKIQLYNDLFILKEILLKKKTSFYPKFCHPYSVPMSTSVFARSD